MKLKKLNGMKMLPIPEVVEHLRSPNGSPTIELFWFDVRAYMQDCLGVLDPKDDAKITKRHKGGNWREYVEDALHINPQTIQSCCKMLFNETAIKEESFHVAFALAALFHHAWRD